MDKEKLFEEHSQLKERLAELVSFISSEEYYRLPDAEKSLIASQRTGMEVYLHSLSVRLWGNMDAATPASSLLPLLMSTMLTPGFSSPSPSGSQEESWKDGDIKP